MRCPDCGEFVSTETARFCGHCGARVGGPRPAAASVRTVAVEPPPADFVEPPRRRWSLSLPVVLGTILAVVAGVGAVAFVRSTSRPPQIAPSLGGPGRAAGFAGPAVPEPQPRWRYEAPSRGDSGFWVHMPGSVGDRAFVATDGGLHAVDRSSGDVLWRTVAVEHLSGPPVVADGVVVVPGHDRIAGIDATSGDVLWQTRLGGGGPGLLASDGGETVVAIQFGAGFTFGGAGVLLLDARTGDRTGSIVLDPVGDSIPQATLVDGKLVVSAQPGWGSGSTLHVYDLATGHRRWSQEVLGEVDVGDDTVVAVAGGPPPDRLIAGRLSRRFLTAYDLDSGAVRWSRRVQTLTDVSAVVGAGSVFVADRGELVAHGAGGGAERWRVPDVDHVVAAGEGIVIGRRGSTTVAIAPEDGSRLWEAAGHVDGAVIDGDEVIIQAESSVIAFAGVDGTERWRFDAAQGGCSVAAIDDEIVASVAGTVVRLDGGGAERWRTARGGGSSDLQSVVGPSALVIAWTTWSDRGPESAVEVLDPSTGRPRWEHRSPSGGEVGTPLLLEDEVVVPFADRSTGRSSLTVFDAATGEVRWEEEFDQRGSVVNAYHPDRGIGVRTTEDGRLEAFDLASARVRWHARPPGQAWNVPILVDDAVVQQVGSGIAVYELSTGDRRWNVGVRPTDGGHAVAATDEVVVAGDGAGVVVIDLATGEVVGRIELTSPVHGGIALAGGVAHVATRRGLETVDLRDLRRVTAIATDRLVIAPPLLFDGRMALCLEGGTIAVYD